MTESNAEKLAILTVVYENYEVIADFLKSLDKQTNTQYKLFVADLSKNKKVLHLKNIDAQLIESENLGYAHGVNIGIKAAIEQGYTKFCVINDDTYFEEEFVEKVLHALGEHPHSLIGGKIYYAPGYEYHTDRYSEKDLGHVLWYAGGHVDWNHVITYHRGVDEIDKGQFDTVEKTDFITGCCFCFDKQVVETIGYWDESYFLYYEDSDYCERAKRARLSLFYDPQILIWHKNGQSTEGSGSKIQVNYQRSNRVKFALKYAPLRTKLHVLKDRVFEGR
jgi:GT2 family glycosyltransferase